MRCAAERAALLPALVTALAMTWSGMSGVAGSAAPPTPAYAPPGLLEASGLTASVLHPGIVWVVEDSGEPVVRSFDQTGTQVASVLFRASDVFAGDNRDTEALAMGPGPTLWSADIGDNNAVRETVLVHTTPEPVELADHEVTATSYRFTFPDGPRDAEAFLVDPVDGRAYVGTKSLGGGGWYAAPVTLTAGDTHPLTRVQGLGAWVTDGAFSPDGSTVALRSGGFPGGGGGEATLYDVGRAPGEPATLTERGTVPLPDQEQGESLTFTADGTTLLTGSEGTTEPIWAVPIPAELLEPGTAPPPAPERPASLDATTAATPSATAVEAASRTCSINEPGACLTSPAALLVALLAALVALLATIAALRRRS